MNARHSITAAIIALALNAGVVTAAAAGTVTHTVTPAQQACMAFGAWERNETAANLGRLVTASLPLGRSWLKADVLELAATVSSPSAKSGKYVKTDRNYVTEDCAKL